jgi:hypothetical protein
VTETATAEPTETSVPPTPTATIPLDCGPTVIVLAEADSWIDQNSASNNFGADSILKVRSLSPHDDFQTVIKFTLPAQVTPGCEIESATLRLYAASATTGRTLEAYRISGYWTENSVTWSNQPATTGRAARTASGAGYIEWDVTAIVQLMYTDSNNGFLIRDSNGGGGGSEQQFHSREKGENMPELVISFGQAP